MFKEFFLGGDIKDEEIMDNITNNINDRYFNIDNNPSSKNTNNSLKKNVSFNSDDNDEDLDIELESISQKIPLENFGINKDERYIRLEKKYLHYKGRKDQKYIGIKVMIIGIIIIISKIIKAIVMLIILKLITKKEIQ